MPAPLTRLLGGFGVRARLLAAFGAMVALTVAVGGVGWLGFDRVQQALEDLQRESLPRLYQTTRLAEQSNGLILQAQVVANAKLLFHLDWESRRLEEKLAAFLDLVRRLPADPDNAADPDQPSLDSLAERIQELLLEFVELARGNIFLTAAMQDLQYRLSSAAAAVERAAAGEQPAAPALLRAEFHRAAGLLQAAPAALGPPELAALAAAFEATRPALLAAARTLGEGERQTELRRAVAELLRLAEGEDSVFAARRRQFENADRRQYLLTLGSILSSQLVDRVFATAAATTAAARERSDATAAALGEAKFRILLLGAVCLGAALLAAFYVVRDLAGNLLAVTAAMRRLADGNRTVAVPATHRPDEIGTLARTFNVFKENTLALDRASEQLREQTRLLQAIFDSMRDGLTAFDGRGRLVSWNGRFLDLYGLTPDEVHPGMPIEAIHRLLERQHLTVRSLDGRLMAAAEVNARRQRTPQQFEQHLADGRVLELRSNPMPGGGFVTIHTDLTERKTIEEQLRQSQKMETLGQLTGGIAHDFNNLLAVIVGNLDGLQEPLAGQDKLQRRARRALDAADRAATLTQRLLAFSRKQALQPRELDVNHLVEGMLDLLGYSVGERVRIVTDLHRALWPTVIDPGQLENALMNLVVNSRDALPDGGRLVIRTGNRGPAAAAAARPYPVPPGRWVVLEVADNGQGMAPEVLERVFEPFFTTKAVGAGSGLGLSMIYGFVSQSGGQVRIQSAPGAGTSVALWLPAAAGERAAALPAAPAPAPGPGGETLLVVEDDPQVRQMAVDLLEELGYQTLEAGDGSSALVMLEDGAAVDLLFTDVVLAGGLNGPALAAQARRLRPGLNVLYTSGYSRDALVRDGRLPEGVELLPKPYDRRTLGERLRAVLGREAGG